MTVGRCISPIWLPDFQATYDAKDEEKEGSHSLTCAANSKSSATVTVAQPSGCASAPESPADTLPRRGTELMTVFTSTSCC